MNKFLRKCIMDRKIVKMLIQKMSFNAIAKQLKVSKVRIRKINLMSVKEGYLEGRPLPDYPQAIFTYSDKIINREISPLDSR